MMRGWMAWICASVHGQQAVASAGGVRALSSVDRHLTTLSRATSLGARPIAVIIFCNNSPADPEKMLPLESSSLLGGGADKTDSYVARGLFGEVGD